jgi:hypothetical protein
MRSKDMTSEQKFRKATQTGWITGPRWAFGPLFIERQVSTFNDMLLNKGWEPITVISSKAETSLLRKGISFTLSGQAYPIALFMETMDQAVKAYSL